MRVSVCGPSKWCCDLIVRRGGRQGLVEPNEGEDGLSEPLFAQRKILCCPYGLNRSDPTVELRFYTTAPVD